MNIYFYCKKVIERISLEEGGEIKQDTITFSNHQTMILFWKRSWIYSNRRKINKEAWKHLGKLVILWVR